MRKRLIHGLGALALVLGGAPAIGQEKPPVLPPKPVVEFAGDFNGDWIVNVFPGGDRWPAFAVDGVFIEGHETSQPLMKGALALTVEEMEKALQVIPGADLLEGLAALGTAEKAAMKVRRLLPAQTDSVEESAEGDEESSSSTWIAFTSLRGGAVQRWVVRGRGHLVFQGAVRFQSHDRTPTQEAQDSLRDAVTSLRHAGDRGDASAALDEVDKSVTALRVLLWEKKGPKHN